MALLFVPLTLVIVSMMASGAEAATKRECREACAGQIDACIHTCAGPWDLAPFMTIVEEAGGRLTDLAGGRTFEGPFVLASNGLIHDKLVEIVSAAASGEVR